MYAFLIITVLLIADGIVICVFFCVGVHRRSDSGFHQTQQSAGNPCDGDQEWPGIHLVLQQ